MDENILLWALIFTKSSGRQQFHSTLQQKFKR